MAKGFTKDPTAHKGIQRGERYGQHAQQHVAEREIRDEEIGDGVHLTVPPDDEDHQHVTEYAQHKDNDVEQAKYYLHRQIWRYVLRQVARVARRHVLHGDQYHRRYLRRVVIHDTFWRERVDYSR